MNKKQIVKYLFLVAVIGIAASVLISKCGHQLKENRTERKEDKTLVKDTHKLDSLSALAERLIRVVDKHKVEDSLSKIAANRLIQYWKNKALNDRVKVDTIINSNPDLKEFVGDQDSLISVTSNRIDSLEKEKVRQWNDFTKMLSISEEQTKLEHEKGLILQEQRDRYKKKAEKRFSIGPAISIDYRLQPSIVVGLQYRLFRF